MGFFSDLKDDLSQAVNELMPEEAEDGAQNTEEAVAAEETVVHTEAEGLDTDLNQLLDKVDEMEIPEEATEAAEEIEEAIYVAPTREEKKMDFADQSAKIPSDEVSILTESLILNGNIATEGSLDIRGSIVGNIEALGKLNITGSIQGDSQAAEIYAEAAKITGELRSSGSIKVGQSTVIVGNIFATSAVVAGAVKGDIDVVGPVILDASAIVMGNIKSKSVQINNGAVIEGMCSQCYADVNPTSFFEELKKMK